MFTLPKWQIIVPSSADSSVDSERQMSLHNLPGVLLQNVLIEWDPRPKDKEILLRSDFGSSLSLRPEGDGGHIELSWSREPLAANKPGWIRLRVNNPRLVPAGIYRGQLVILFTKATSTLEDQLNTAVLTQPQRANTWKYNLPVELVVTGRRLVACDIQPSTLTPGDRPIVSLKVVDITGPTTSTAGMETSGFGELGTGTILVTKRTDDSSKTLLTLTGFPFGTDITPHYQSSVGGVDTPTASQPVSWWLIDLLRERLYSTNNRPGTRPGFSCDEEWLESAIVFSQTHEPVLDEDQKQIGTLFTLRLRLPPLRSPGKIAVDANWDEKARDGSKTCAIATVGPGIWLNDQIIFPFYESPEVHVWSNMELDNHILQVSWNNRIREFPLERNSSTYDAKLNDTKFFRYTATLTGLISSFNEPTVCRLSVYDTVSKTSLDAPLNAELPFYFLAGQSVESITLYTTIPPFWSTLTKAWNHDPSFWRLQGESSSGISLLMVTCPFKRAHNQLQALDEHTDPQIVLNNESETTFAGNLNRQVDIPLTVSAHEKSTIAVGAHDLSARFVVIMWPNGNTADLPLVRGFDWRFHVMVLTDWYWYKRIILLLAVPLLCGLCTVAYWIRKRMKARFDEPREEGEEDLDYADTVEVEAEELPHNVDEWE